MSKSRFFNVWAAGIIVGVTLVFTAPSLVRAAMLDLQQAANFNSTKQPPFGWCTSITVGSSALSAELPAMDPTTNTKVSVAGWLSSLDSHQVQVSAAGQQQVLREILAVINGDMSRMSAAVSGSLSCSVFTYDKIVKKYTRKNISSSMSSVAISTDPNTTLQSPKNYTMTWN